MLKLDDCARLSLVTTSDASGMDEEQRCPLSRLDPAEEPGRKHRRKRHASMVSCARTTRHWGGSVHPVKRAVWYSISLS
jgi:hypothetical protein